MDWEDVKTELVQRSKAGGAWVAVRRVFSTEWEFRCYQSPCRVPDSMIERCSPWIADAVIGYKGRLVPFTRAARIREQNRAMGCD